MKRKIILLFLAFTMVLLKAQQNLNTETIQNMDRTELSQRKYKELFDSTASTSPESDPELMGILRKFIFGDVFYTGGLNDTLRELITIVSLSTQQTLPQLKAHTQAALNIGISPITIKEAVYQCAPFIGFPKVLNALNEINQVFMARNIPLPLEYQGTVTEDDRFEKGKAMQYPIYGDGMKDNLKGLPGGMDEMIPRFLTELCFGDFYTRGGLDIKTRELLILCILATLGTERQLNSHAIGNLKVGNSKEMLIAAMVHCIPYIGFPLALNAIYIIKEL